MALIHLVNSESILKALEAYKANLPSGLIPGTGYEVIYEGVSMPPKELVRKAAEIQRIPNYLAIEHKTNTSMLRKLGEYLEGTGAEIKNKRGSENPIFGKILELLKGHPLSDHFNAGAKNYWYFVPDPEAEGFQRIHYEFLMGERNNFRLEIHFEREKKAVGKFQKEEGRFKALSVGQGWDRKPWESCNGYRLVWGKLKPVSDQNLKEEVEELKRVYEKLNPLLIDILQSMDNDPDNNTAIEMNLPINLIYYGPPGTGKTFKINQLRKDHFTDQNATRPPEEYLREKVAKYPFWQILAAVLGSTDKPVSVPELTENPLVLAKRNPENTTTLGSILWRVLPQYSDDSSTKVSEKYRSGIPLFTKKEKSRWTLVEGVREELGTILAPELIQLAKNPVLTQGETSGEVRRYQFITFHQKYGYEDFIEGIKPVLRNEESEEQAGELQFELKKGIFYNSCMEALKLAGYQSFEECKKDTPESRELKFKAATENPKQCFALFIDEINRANISAVFGELITLLEDDKRIGAKHEMWLTLPGSDKLFGVPSNLYLIGTMNTADRSIALVDIALRRRFEFKGLYPEYPENSWWGATLKSINQKIHDERKGADFFIGHAFFIDKEETEKTRIFNHKIIPLLLEYFQNNLDKVQSILKGSGIETEDLTIENNYQIVASETIRMGAEIIS